MATAAKKVVQAWEDAMTKKGYSFRFETSVPMEKIDKHPSSQARVKASPRDIVNIYATQMKEGAQFPPLVCWDDPKYPDAYALLDGNTRFAARQTFDPKGNVDTYVLFDLQSDDEAVVASAIPNLNNGVPYGRDERHRLALVMLKLNYSNETIAKETGLSVATVLRIQGVENFEARRKKLGLDPTRLDKTAKTSVVVVPDDAVFRDLVELADAAKMSVADVKTLVKSTLSAGSEVERLQIVTNDRKDRAKQIADALAGKNATQPPMHESLMALGRLVKLCQNYPVKADWVPASEEKREEWLPRIVALRGCIDDLITAYEDA